MAIRVELWWRLIPVGAMLLCGWAAAVPVVGQEPIVPIQISFSDPGARSMGFGGAFVALADDATAAFSNPAGLVQLAKPEVSLEGRRWSYSTPYTERGRVEGDPSGFGADTEAGLRTAASDDAVARLSFISLAYPKGKWSFAFFRHQLADFEFSGETHGLFGGGTNCCQVRFYDQRLSSELNFASYGLSTGYRVHERFDIGFGLVYHETAMASRATMFLPDEDPTTGALAPTSFLPERSLISQTLSGESTDWSLTGGFLWRPSSRWRVGGVYRQGPEIGVAPVAQAGPAWDPAVAAGTVLAEGPVVRVELPSVLGLGFAYRAPDGALTLSFQWDRIEYSSLLESLEEASAADDPLELAVYDAHELHVGAEYVFVRSTPVVAARLGAWYDPDHQIFHSGDDPFLGALQPRGSDEMHYALGFGIAFRRFQIDAGVDFSDPVDTASLSVVSSF